MNVYKFPYDSQICSIVIGSWTLSNTQIIMNHKSLLRASGFVENSVWKLKNTNVYVQNTTRLSDQYLTSDIYFEGTVQRKPMYYILNNIYPCLILNVITLFSFIFPFQLQSTLSIYLYIFKKNLLKT
jgi:hypothetical protein